ncbi:MAG TPA: hypothetical protein VLO11_14560 [Luteolibacter sp.]|nr:hypothetical protein [Luteolibacter sp.]
MIAATTLELRDAPPPDPLLPGIGLWPWWFAAVVPVIALIVWIMFKHRKPAAVDPLKIREHALHEAVAALDAVQTNDPRDAAVQSSLILRRYLSLAVHDPALFETHEEFIARHDALNGLNDNARAAAADGFARLAALKYAPVTPQADAATILTDSRQLLHTLHHGFVA